MKWTLKQWRTMGQFYRAELDGIPDLSKLTNEHIQLIAQAIREFRDSDSDHAENVGLNMPSTGEPVFGVPMPGGKVHIAAKKETTDG